MKKPRALQAGDRIMVVAPASPLAARTADEELKAGGEEIRALGFEVEFDLTVFEHAGYTAGSPQMRASAFKEAWVNPGITGIVAARGGYGSVQLLPLLDPADFEDTPKAFIGYSDNTSLM